jgi:hypothetical protein
VQLVLEPYPKLVLAEPVFSDNMKYTSFGLFSAPSKMNAPSFSLPAGPPGAGGSCIGARLVPGRGILSETSGKFVCAVCYAMTGRYPIHALSQAVRQQWVISLLRTDPTGQHLRKALSTAISALAKTTAKWRRNSCPMEFGIWNEQGFIQTSDGCPTQFTRLPGPFVSSTNAIERLAPKPGQVAGYFRWLDSGDVNIGEDPRLWTGFVQAIGGVAEDHPAVLFWLPTRSQFQPDVLNALRSVAQQPNLMVRPSAYLDAGTAVYEASFSSRAGLGEHMNTYKGKPLWGCPAYLGSKSATCLNSGCRACWLASDLPVWYPLHVSGKKR